MSQSILIVDDEPYIVKSLEHVMKKAGFEVNVAYDGEEGLAKAESTKPDLMILDVMMPKRDGFSVCEAVRANPELKDTRIIILTAKGRDTEREKGLALGADEYLTKPFSTRDILQSVKNLLETVRA